MRFTKAFVFAALAAIAAMAFIGAGSAQADKFVTLCKEDLALCPHEKEFPAGTVLDGHAVNPTLKGTLTEKCNESNTSGKTSAQMGEGSLLSEITSLSFSGSCSPCSTVTVENLPNVAHLLMVGALTGKEYHIIVLNGRAHLSGGLFCPSEGCTFEGKEVLLTVEGGNPGHLVATNAELKRVGGPAGLCGETGLWTANYSVTALEGTTKVGVWPSLTELP